MHLMTYLTTTFFLLCTIILTSPTPPLPDPNVQSLPASQPSQILPISTDLDLPGSQYAYQYINLLAREPVLHLSPAAVDPLFEAVQEEIATHYDFNGYVPAHWSYDFAGIPKFEGLVFRAKVFRKYRWPALMYALHRMRVGHGLNGAPGLAADHAMQPAFAVGVTWGPRDAVVAILKFCDVNDVLCPYAN